MNDQVEIEIYRALNLEKQKYTYFLLTAAGAGIILAINQTKGVGLDLSQIPLALGVLSWGASFYSGCCGVSLVQSLLFSNIELIKVQKGVHPNVGEDQSKVIEISEIIRKAMDSQSDKSQAFLDWQFKLLIIGGLFYITWHVFEMSLIG